MPPFGRVERQGRVETEIELSILEGTMPNLRLGEILEKKKKATRLENYNS